ncbi:MAG TPA: hypothetical protein VGN20_28495 [Mucilaginibacter sp.]
MTFEEFFSKKRIDLLALNKAEPALFSEFKTHFHQMGEKSFDHTKKYWFNKIRRQFPLAPEVKTEKVHIANPLAEQTITESLIEAVAPSPKLGFVPKFKMGNMPKPAANEDKKDEVADAPIPENKPAESAEPKAAYVPKFKMKPKVETTESKPEADSTPTLSENTDPKPAYVPKFKMKPKVETTENQPEPDTTPTTPEKSEVKLAYRPRFNMKNIPPKATEE